MEGVVNSPLARSDWTQMWVRSGFHHSLELKYPLTMSKTFTVFLLACLHAKLGLSLVNNSELVALDAIFYSTNGAEWAWLTDPAAGMPWIFDGACAEGFYIASCDPCDGHWQGVACAVLTPAGPPPWCGGGPSRYFPDSGSYLCVNSTVVGLDVSQRHLIGSLPDAFHELPSLLNVNGSRNSMSGVLPASLFALSGLVNLSLYSNCFYGTIPNLSRAMSLEMLTLTSNRLRGPIPSEVGYLPNLKSLTLGNNSISSSIPTSLGASVSLRLLDVSANKLRGSIPPAIAGMKRLHSLLLSLNSLTRTLPSELGMMTGLSVLSLRFNCISGTLPSEIGSMSSLAILLLGSNRMYGSIPSALSNLSTLDTLGLTNNAFNGTIPSALSTLTNLVRLGIEANSISGSLPTEFGNLKNLRYIELDDNLLQGPLPEFFVSLSNLQSIDFENNCFSGTIPSAWGSLSSMVNIDLSGNSLRGSLPSELLNWKALETFEVNDNAFTGRIYSTMSVAFSNLIRINLGQNSFSGSLPSDLWNITKLEVLYLAKNCLYGSIPSDIGRLRQLNFLNLGVNSFTGTIPEAIGRLTKLRGLLLDKNSLSGTIPPVIATLSHLEVLALSKNSLSGTLPTLSAMTNLTNVTVQRNFLEGSLDGVFSEQQQQIVIIDVADNAFTGTLPLSLFNHSKLRLVSASMNCFRGSIPQEICFLVPGLEELVLDGLTSGRTCRKSLGFFFEFYVLQRDVVGGIPDCLFQLPDLKRFHASGNGIRSKLPDIPKDSKLSQIQLAWNNINGEIPESFLNVEFAYLDLGVNKISGGSDRVRIDAAHPDSHLALHNNRLSGKIPTGFRDLPSVRILEGNLFECSLDRNELPQADPSYAQYTCGSDATDQALILCSSRRRRKSGISEPDTSKAALESNSSITGLFTTNPDVV
jgi:LRR receptor-like serine/threonine-protein kinase FLS2